MLFTVPSTGGFSENHILLYFTADIYENHENHTHSAFKNPYKKIHETQKLESFHEKLFIERKNRKKLESEKTQIYAQIPRLKMPFKNSISGTSVAEEEDSHF